MKVRGLIEEAVKQAWQYDPSEVRKQLNAHKEVFLYLRAHYRAYDELRRCILRGENPREVFFQLPRPDLVAQLYGRMPGSPNTLPPPSRERNLPRWFRQEVGTHLLYPHKSEGADLTYWVMSRLLQDGIFMDAVDLVRKRWRIKVKEQESWFKRMHDEQEKLYSYCASRRIHILTRLGAYPEATRMAPRDWPAWEPGATFLLSEDPSRGGCGLGFPDPGGVRFLECFDLRDVSTYEEPLQFGGLGFPIHDYHRDLGALSWLAGGDPESEEWRIWIELIVWNFQDSPIFGSPDPELAHWDGFGRNIRFGKVCSVTGPDHGTRQEGLVRRLPSLVEVQRTKGQVGVRFQSRWVRLSSYSEQMLPELVAGIVGEWGDYEEPPDPANLHRAVAALARPRSLKEVLAAVDALPESQDDSVLGLLDRRYANSAVQRRSRQSQRHATPQGPLQRAVTKKPKGTL